MRLIDVNDKIVSCNVNQSSYPIREVSKSKFQKEIGILLRNRFNLYSILEEWTIPSSRLSLDFFVPQVMIAVEAHGDQHRKYSRFFHASREDFLQQVRRDNVKRGWCEKNGIELISGFTIEEIEGKIKNA